MGAETEPEVRTSEEGDRGSLASRELEKDKPGEGRPRWPGILGAGRVCASRTQARTAWRRSPAPGQSQAGGQRWVSLQLAGASFAAQTFIRRKSRTGELWEDKGCG